MLSDGTVDVLTEVDFQEDAALLPQGMVAQLPADADVGQRTCCRSGADKHARHNQHADRDPRSDRDAGRERDGDADSTAYPIERRRRDADL